ncbi:D-alanyl-D-alanine carboxypeptidase family protein [Fictibacillus enclensis]|uniref:D-alanyl-D-alanine carboxypeptidase family protein n=1 Tax=Fictibacillus enclensis TaxID=1017270 RepID=UPI0025A0CDE3|nr:D-alanyl-D-alanine carboxypeptidase family protein [Fictibacillus enclensis]MDM5338807.1 D-alanyl-D-alanine carboxypeptidase family protein [Fictibacillus enclensis]
MRYSTKKWTMLIIVAALLMTCMPPQVKAAGPGVSARAAILMEQESGRILYARNEHRPMRIASITKIMTAILAIESGKLSDRVTISDRATRTEGSSLYLKPEEHISLNDLVYGLILRSGNDSAVAIAEYVGGSLDGFVYMMNQKAREIGMKNTLFRNPHGLDDHDDHYSSAYDMALLTRYAMENEKFREISSSVMYRSPQEGEKWERVWRNKNKMLKLYPYSTGGKTGYTKLAKRTLVSTAKKEDMGLIAVTLNDPNDWEDHAAMFNWGYRTFKLTSLVKKGVVDGIKLKAYENKIEAARDLNYPLMKGEKREIQKSVNLYQPPKGRKWKKGAVPKPIGKMKVMLGDQIIGNLPLFYEGKGLVKEDRSIWNVFKQMVASLFAINGGTRHG